MFQRSKIIAITCNVYLKILIILLCGISVKNDDAFYDDNDLDDITIYDTTINKTEIEDLSPFLIATLLFSFSVIVSFVGVVICHISFKEDCLLKAYQKNGIKIDADVLSFDYARASLGSRHNERPEFKVLIEYTVSLEGNYLARVQKQVKSSASDFKLKPQQIESKLSKSSSIESEKALRTKFSFPSELKEAIGVDVGNEEYFLKTLSTSPEEKHQYSLDILVIPGIPKSGHPLKEIQRHRKCSYRSHTFFLIFFLFSIASLCLFIAISTLIDAQVLPEDFSFTQWSIIGITITLILEFLIIYSFLDRMFTYLLEEEYFYNGDFASSYCDETSLSSGSDMLLSESKHSKPGWVKEFVEF